MVRGITAARWKDERRRQVAFLHEDAFVALVMRRPLTLAAQTELGLLGVWPIHAAAVKLHFTGGGLRSDATTPRARSEAGSLQVFSTATPGLSQDL